MSSGPIVLRSTDRGARLRGGLFHAVLIFSVTIGFVLLAVLLVDVLRKGLPFVDGVLLTEPPSSCLLYTSPSPRD